MSADPHDEMQLQEMREELAMTLQWATDYSIESCRRDIDNMTDGQVWDEWQRQQQDTRPAPSRR